MDSEADNVTPIVPHNSVVDFQNVHSADDGNNNFSKRGWRDDRNVVGYQPLKRTIEDGRAARESLKARLYDRPENSEVFRAMLRPSESLSTTHSQMMPHPPPTGGPKAVTGAYRTTIYKRDHKRLQAQRKLPRIGNETVAATKETHEVYENSKPVESQPAFLSKVPSVTSLSSLKHDEPQPSVLAQKKPSPDRSRPVSAKSSVSSLSSRGSTVSKSSRSVRSAGCPARGPGLTGVPDDDMYVGLNVMSVICRLRARLNMSTDLEAIADGQDPDEDELNLQKLNIKDDDGKFLYCLQTNRNVRVGRYNPYDLTCVTSKQAQACSQYFTVTASAVTQIRDGYDSDLTPLARWLYERKNFYKIYNKPVFDSFRMWKAFTCWKQNVRFSKNAGNRCELDKRLFSANAPSQLAILKVRELCESASSSLTGVGKDEHAIWMLQVDAQNTCTLEEFEQAQSEQTARATEQLSELRNRVLTIVKDACEKMSADEGLTEWIHPERKKEITENKTKKESKNKKDEKDSKPTFTQIAQWRGVLERMACFIRLIDFLVMELLRRLVQVSTRTLLAQTRTSSVLGAPVKLGLMELESVDPARKDEIQSILKNTEHGMEETAVALLKVELVLNVQEQPEIPKLPPSPKKSVTFSMTPATDVKESVENGGPEESSVGTPQVTSYADESSSSSAEPAGPSSLKSPPGSSPVHVQSQICLNPTEEEFESTILSIIYGFEQAVTSFNSLVKDPQLSVYVNPPPSDTVYTLSRDAELEAKAKKIPWPDTYLLFSEDEKYQSDVRDIVLQIRDEANRVVSFSKKFDRFCVMVDKAKKVDVDVSISEREWNTEEFYAVLNVHTEQVLEMKEMTLSKRVGLFNVDCSEFQSSCLPYPEKVLHGVARHLPVIAAKRNDALLNVVKHASRKLDKTPESVEAFVEHLVFLHRMGNEISALEREYNIVTRMYSIARNFDVPITAEELALYQTLMPSFQHLKSTILYCEAKKDEHIMLFSRQLDELISSVRRDLVTIKNKARSPNLLDSDNIPQVASEKIKFLAEELEGLSRKTRNYATYQERFGSSMSTAVQRKSLAQGTLSTTSGHTSPQAASLQAEVTEVERDLVLRRLLWDSLHEWQGLVDQWEATAFEALNIEEMQKDVTRFIQTVYLLEKGLPPNKVVPRLKQKVTSFKQGVPVITSLRNPSLRLRHWEAIQNLIGTRIVRDKYFTLGNLLQLKVFQHKEKIADISSQASNEATLEQMLQKVMEYWNHTDFQLKAHTNRDVAVIIGADDIISALEESQVTLGNIRGSRFVTPIKAVVEDWDRKLTLFSRTIDEWLLCQRNWLYLETIFSAADIQRQLPNEARLFSQVDKTWKDIMRRTIDRPNAMRAATAAGVLEVLQANNSHLEKIHRCLEDYLETKRLVFARFYFVSNEDLLDILANQKRPNSVQPHLRKCFGNIQRLEIVRQAHSPPQIQLMMSEEGETVHLPKTLRARGNVESWLHNVELAMYDTVKLHLKKAVADLSREYTDWVLSHPGQVVLTVSQIVFNRDVVRCFNTPRAKEALTAKRDSLLSVLHTLSQLVTSQLAYHQRQTLEALLTILVHQRDILESFITGHIYKQDDFEWARQLRYEWDDEHNTCTMRHSNAVFEYGYEYLGCSPRLVMTPLTDKCYLTLTGALHLHLSGAPSGPAGTGKTETVKDLAKAMGKQCLVFNCSEGLDYKMMGKFFSGSSQSGSWCCFDEFNRIDVEVLSVIAQQLRTIKAAKENNLSRFLFEGRDIKLKPNCGVFITMNPGYAGRVELPDNLKSLFRPVAMMVPDFALIAEIILFSNGFTAAAMLSRKLVNLYELASKQLSQQDHYDFGLRAVKSVLIMAGKQRYAASLSDTAPEQLEEAEAHILIEAVRDVNLPKFVLEDVPLFEGILADLFPGLSPTPPDNKLLERAVKYALGELSSVQYWNSQVAKVIQLYNTLLVRHGVMLVGPTGSGKTTARQILRKALVVLPSVSLEDEQGVEPGSGRAGVSAVRAPKVRKGTVAVTTLNPKCVTVSELYGEFNPTTVEWTDGLLSYICRRYAKESRMLLQRSLSRKKSQSHIGSSSIPSARSVSRTPSARSISTTFSTTSFDDGTEVETTIGEETSMAPSSVEDNDRDVGQNGVPLHWYWMVMDGPVDTLWVENLNTVLDDTKVLCLANGERIGIGPGMRMLFEVDNLSMASPATISRCGMIYMDSAELGWKPFVKTWLLKLRDSDKMPLEIRDLLEGLFGHSVDRGLQFIRSHQQYQHVPAPELSIVSTLCSIISGFVDIINANGGIPGALPDNASEPQELGSAKSVKFSDESNGETKPRNRRVSYAQRNPERLLSFFGRIFVFAYTWAFGGNLDSRDGSEGDEEDLLPGYTTSQSSGTPVRLVFDTFVRDLFENDSPVEIQLPVGNETMFAYYVDLDGGQFQLWNNLVLGARSLIAKSLSEYNQILDTVNILDDPLPSLKQDFEIDRSLVPTVDSVRYAFLLSLLALRKQPVLLTGATGIGKTALIHDTLKRLSQPGGTGTGTGSILGSVFRAANKNILESIIDITTLAERPVVDQSNIAYSSMQFSAHTTPARAQHFIESRLVRRGRDVLGPKPGQKALIFIDDLNMPQPDQYKSQPPLELMRQLLDSGGFFDTKKLMFKEVHDITILAACGPPGGGRNTISERLLRNFSILCLPHPSVKWLIHIYTTQLGRFLEKIDFSQDVRDSCGEMVTTSLGLYFKLSAHLLPTPGKTHYTFNLRDLTKVMEGLLQAHPSVISLREHCAQLLGHEATRVFHDRLVDEADREFFYKVLSDELHNGFRVRWSPEQLQNKPFVFGDFLDASSPHSTRAYRFVRSYDRLPKVLEEYYDRANLSGGSVEHRFVFFNIAVQHVIRAARVFRQPGGHVMMVGVGGTGKSTVAKLAAYIQECHFMRPYVSRGYQNFEFREDLKKAYMHAGIKGDKVVLFLTDNLVKESFLEEVSCIISDGEIPNLFDHEDLERISIELNKDALQNGVRDTKEAIFQFFLNRVKHKLHVVISTSPAGSTFRHRCRLYPALINCTTIDWFDKWPYDALESVAMSFLESAPLGEPDEQTQDLLRVSLGRAFVAVHKSVEDAAERFYEEMRRLYHTTPTSYMEFVRLYLAKLHEKRTKLTFNCDRLSTGLQKLAESNELVGAMQTELMQLGPKLEQKAKDTEKLLEQLARDQQAVDQVHNVVQKEEEIMNEEARRVQAIADEAQTDLDNVLPQLEMAITALDSLDKSDISEIRVYTKPPPMVMTVLGAVCVLLQQKPDWNTAKLLLGDQGFLKRLVQYDKNAVPDKVFTRLKRYTQNPEFNPEAVGKISSACRSMCQWVLALDNYAEVYKIVQPKQKRCEEAQVALSIAQENLKHKQTSLAKIQEQLNILQQQYNDSVAQLNELRNKKELTLVRLDRASTLTRALAEEQGRWTKSVGSLDGHSKSLVGDTLVGTAAIAYIGAFTPTYRRHLLSYWLQLCQTYNITVSENFELTEFLAEPIEIQRWLNYSLPHDKHSIENAVLIKNCRMWPLLMDPQEQASKWIVQMEKDNGLKVVKASDPNFLRTLESAIPLGEPVLIEDVGETLDPSLNPILSKNTSQRGNQLVINIGDTEIEYNENFRLYMTTLSANPHFLPEVCIKVTLINFTVTLEGLEDQLLSRVVREERPELEEKRTELLHGLVNDRFRLRELEDRALTLLHSSRGNILDDEDLIQTLDDSKKMADVIQSRVIQSEDTEETINFNREKYLSVATRGAVLYFVLTDLAAVDVMYQFSLPWFTRLFANCVESVQDQAPRTESQRTESPIRPGSAGTIRPSDVTRRVSVGIRPGFKRRITVFRPRDESFLPEYLKALVNLLTENVYRVVSHALFARHQLTFSFMLCTSILRHASSTQRRPTTQKDAASPTEGLDTRNQSPFAQTSSPTYQAQSTTNEKGSACSVSGPSISEDSVITDTDWAMFLRGAVAAAISDRLGDDDEDGLLTRRKSVVSQTISAGSMGQYMKRMNKPPAKWITEAMWKECSQLSSALPAFSGLCSNIMVNSKFWNKFSKADNPYKLLARGEDWSSGTADQEGDHSGSGSHLGWHWRNLSRFQRLMLVKVLRPESLVETVRAFVTEQMGARFVTSVGFDLQEIFEDSSARTPLIFILSPGSDPTTQLMRFAKEIRGSTLHLDMISLGRGQGPRAEEIITKAYQQKGRWVFLQNCHHAGSFMPSLQHIVRKISDPETEVDPQFRMWLSSKPDLSFPVSILQVGHKMTVEPPPSLKANLSRSFVGVGGVVTEDVFEDTGPGPAWKRLLFGLCFFNAVVHERKKFGALGWNIPYEFSASDLEVSVQMLHMLLMEHKEVPWKALGYLTGDIAYGGRVTDAWDNRCLQSIMGKFYTPRALEEDYGYTSNLVYRPPPVGISHSVCCSYIEELPAADSPEIFGMDLNAHIAFQKEQGRSLVDHLLLAEPRVTPHVSSAKTNSEVVVEVARDILKHVPRHVDPTREQDTEELASPRYGSVSPERVRKMAQKDKSNDPLDNSTAHSALIAVLRHEVALFDRLLDIVYSSLNSLCLAVKGQIVMSETLEDTFDALLNNRLPRQWQHSSYQSCKPLGSWIDNLARRVDFFSRWLDCAKAATDSKMLLSRSSAHLATPSSSQSSFTQSRDQPRAFWLSAFFYPQGFLTSVLQSHSRLRGLPVDSLTFDYKVLATKWTNDDVPTSGKEIDFSHVAFQGAPQEHGVIVFGLYLDGAVWDEGSCCLAESLPGQRFYPLPEMGFTPVQIKDPDSPSTTELIDEEDMQEYECPVYRTSLRASSLTSAGHTTNFVTSVNLRTHQPADYWITRGVALLCQLDD